MDLLKQNVYSIIKRLHKINFSGTITFQFKRTYKMCNFQQLTVSTLFNKISNESVLYLFTVSVNKCGGSCNTIDNSCSRVCVPNKIKNMNVKGYNLMSFNVFYFNMNRVNKNIDWIKMHVFKRKNEIIINISVNVKI